MNRKHLGDALDFWKGDLLARLREQSNAIKDLAIVPMITDRRAHGYVWTENELRTYRNLLRLRPGEKILNKGFTFSRRAGGAWKYFTSREIRMHAGDLFLDPGTGVALTTAKAFHLRAAKIAWLLSASNRSRIVMIYQHAPRGGTLIRQLEKVRDQLRLPKPLRLPAADGDQLVKTGNPLQESHICAYVGQQVAMLFISLEQTRIHRIEKALNLIFEERASRHRRVLIL